jgi:subtilase family serine protease
LQVRRKAAFLVSVASLVAAGGLAAFGGSGVAGAAAAAAAPEAVIGIHPDLIQLAGASQAKPPTTADCEAAFNVACYDPTQLEHAYNLPALYSKGITGKGTTIAIVDSFGSPTIQGDLKTFDTTFGLPAPPSFKVIQPDGAVPPFNSGNSEMASWAGETTLDVEYAHAMAPGANILLVETPVAETEGVTGFPQVVKAEEYVLKHYHVDVISQSFEATEQTFPSSRSVQALRSAYLEAYEQHVTVLSASGDSGAADTKLDGQRYYTTPVTSWPDSDPLVTGVGGTQLHLDAKGNQTSPASAWNDTYSVPTNQFIYGANGPNPLASGGGKSILFGRPYYQDGVRNVVGSSRGVPDISMSGACNGGVDVYESNEGGWSETCGTSEATPLFAGIVALAAQVAHHPLGLINPALYQMSAKSLPGIVPVTSGNNTVSFTQGGRSYTVRGYPAQAGYSLVDGVGTVNGALFVPELAAQAGKSSPPPASGTPWPGPIPWPPSPRT